MLFIHVFSSFLFIYNCQVLNLMVFSKNSFDFVDWWDRSWRRCILSDKPEVSVTSSIKGGAIAFNREEWATSASGSGKRGVSNFYSVATSKLPSQDSFQKRTWPAFSSTSKIDNSVFLQLASFINKSCTWSTTLSAVQLQQLRVSSKVAKEAHQLSHFACSSWLIILSLLFSFSSALVACSKMHLIPLSIITTFPKLFKLLRYCTYQCFPFTTIPSEFITSEILTIILCTSWSPK